MYIIVGRELSSESLLGSAVVSHKTVLCDDLQSNDFRTNSCALVVRNRSWVPIESLLGRTERNVKKNFERKSFYEWFLANFEAIVKLDFKYFQTFFCCRTANPVLFCHSVSSAQMSEKESILRPFWMYWLTLLALPRSEECIPSCLTHRYEELLFRYQNK